MKRTIAILLTFFATASALLNACRKIGNDVPATTPVGFTIPSGFPEPKYDFSKNPLTEEGVLLGRKLFYDTELSADGMVSCGTCHEQSAAFSTYDHPQAHGVHNTHTDRNAPGIFNMAWHTTFMHDGRIKTLDSVPYAHFTSSIDYGQTIENIIHHLNQNEKYRIMFRSAFGDETINYDRIGKALSQFVLTIVSADSRYDRVKAGKETFQLAEELGYQIFKQKCVACHTEPLFTDFSFRNIGMPLDPFLKDFGRMTITGKSADSLKFKVPSLRNAFPSYPFGHDGRFYSTMNIYEHYRSQVVDGPTTDPLVKNKIVLSNFEIGQLDAFLRTLTDSTMIKDARFTKSPY